MKALTLSDNSPKNPVPWLSLVEYKFKPIETRTWPTKYRGDVLLCGAADSRTPNKGLATCIVKIVDCIPMVKSHETDACIKVYDGAWAWITEDLRWLTKKFPVKGALGLFDVVVPADIEFYTPDTSLLFPVRPSDQYPMYLREFFVANP